MNTVCGWLRVKNEMETLEKCLKSIENVFDYIIITYNNCTDGSDIFLKSYVKNKKNYYLYEYSYDVISFTDERYLTNNYNWENSMAALNNFGISKIKNKEDYVFKIDCDTIYYKRKLNDLVTFIRHRDNNENDVFVWQGCDCTVKNDEIILHKTHYIKGQYNDHFCCKKSFIGGFGQGTTYEWTKYIGEPNFIKLTEDIIFMNIDNITNTERNASPPLGALKGLSKKYIIEQLKEIYTPVCYNNINDIIILLSNNTNILELYECLNNVKKTVIAYNSEKIPDNLKNTNYFLFTNDILNDYLPISDNLVPGSCHFPVLKFWREHKQYSHYWFIENDLIFNGEWKEFFDAFESFSSSFISTNVYTFNQCPDWPWWASLSHPNKNIPFEDRIHSLNAIYRISNEALNYLHQCFLDGWKGHTEVSFPTLLFNAGYEISDFGGCGDFVKSGFENKFYIGSLLMSDKKIYEIDRCGTVRWRPIVTKDEINKKLLYHPVKLDLELQE